MQDQYYIPIGDKLDGPYDLVTVMRRVRSGKITPTTQILSTAAAAPLPASFIPEIAAFFEQKTLPSPGGTKDKQEEKPLPSISFLIKKGWGFTSEHNIMTVCAGALMLVSIMLLVNLMNIFGNIAGGMIGWCIFLAMQQIYMIFALRLYRGQTTDKDFLVHTLTPALPALLLNCLMTALLTGAGCMVAAFIYTSLAVQDNVAMQAVLVALAIIPGGLIASLFIFAPFLILDLHCSFFSALRQSQQLLARQAYAYYGTAASLTFVQLLFVMLIIPVPLTLPIFSAALVELYEDISAA